MALKPTLVSCLVFASNWCAWAVDAGVSGRITDPQDRPVAGAQVQLKAAGSDGTRESTTDVDGRFTFAPLPPGAYDIRASAPGFNEVGRGVNVAAGRAASVELRFAALASHADSVTVSADVKDIEVELPDPAVKVFASEALMDANPGRPGAPISIPGYPIETASSGIKAPQYFAPGVAGDHGEPIAQFLQVGGYLLPNNLSANAHGNGYADPNIYIASVIESVQVDGGAFNVREGNHALNLATTYGLRTHLDPFLTLTGDQRDVTGTGGFSPSARSWVAAEVSYGNGFLDRLEHRKQVKISGGQVFEKGNHTLSLFGLGYYGFSHIAGLSPIHGFDAADRAAGWMQYPDTIDPRQKDQTHTALIVANDVWRLNGDEQLQFSGFFRTYNLSLFSDFGDGLIRQSEFRTVTGGSVSYKKRFSKLLAFLAGLEAVFARGVREGRQGAQG